ncbi:hypothetical protein O181_039022 [Austropuccinia psidii MF-1]|uniref:Uncharacterized protein n=1 Tax=Austropuccinia psidii MF-1 TaxID=1389203 RepID=A0A9Q3DFX3_9BASI|nr:hypothetical protein [Austropuccinia psidii MF-1]
MVKRGHALRKMCGENGGKWKRYLPLVTLADRIYTKRTTGFSPFEHQFGKLTVLPIDIETKTFLEVGWHKISTTEKLLQARAKQQKGKKTMRRKEAEKLKKLGEDSMKYWDTIMAHQLRSPLDPVDGNQLGNTIQNQMEWTLQSNKTIKEWTI